MKKKLLFVIDSLHSGGAEKSLISLLSLFDYEKYEVELLTFVEGGLYTDLLPNQVTRLSVPKAFQEMKQPMSELIRKRLFSLLFWRLQLSFLLRYQSIFSKITHGAQLMWPHIEKRILQLEKSYDIAIAYSQGTPTYYVATKVKATKKLCWINTDYKAAGYIKSFDKSYYEQFDYMVAVSKTSKKAIDLVYPEFKPKIKVIYDIISENLVNQLATKAIGYEDDYRGTRILTIGRLVTAKGYDFVIKACEILVMKQINFKWYIIGEGILKQDLLQQIKQKNLENHIVFLGTTVNPYPYINESDIYCQPSRFEGFGMAICEAKILHKPIVATNFDIVFDQITHGKNGLVTDMSGESLAKTIEELLRNNGLKEKIIMALEEEDCGTEQEIAKVYALLEE